MAEHGRRVRLMTNAQVWYVIISASICVFFAVMSLFD
jgi:hypothetical protein